MDEPEKPDGRRGLLPALLFAWVVLYLLALLGMWWYACRLSLEPVLALRIHAYLLGILALLFLVGMSGGRAAPAAAAKPEAWLCQHCLKPYVPGAHFCPRCGAPKTFYSGTCPYERAHAQAWILGKAGRHPSRPLHVVGLLLIAGPGALGLLVTLFGHPALAWIGAAATAFLSLTTLLYVALLVMCLIAWTRRRRGIEPAQPEIGYGAPPWFSYDTEWALPEFEEDPGDDGDDAGATPEAG